MSLRPTVCLLLAACTDTWLAPETGPDGLVEARRVCASGPTVEGVDVSYYQGDIDWDRVADDGIAFAITRVSDGTTFRDSRFHDNWDGIARVGLVRGAYQYFRPGQSATAQADLMIDAIGDLGPGDLPPVLDVETADGRSGSTVVAGVRTWLDRVEAATGVRPMIYAASGFWNTLPSTSQFDDHPLWVANYHASCPSMPEPWSDWDFWQYTDRGSVAGIPGGVDTNLFQGDEADLRRFAGVPGLPMGVDWDRNADGTFTFTATAPAAVRTVRWTVDGYDVGATSQGGDWSATVRLTQLTPERHLVATGLDASGVPVARGVGLFDAVAGTGVFVRQVGEATYEVGLERAPSAVAAIEVSADGWPVTDDATRAVRSARLAVLHTYSDLGRRDFALETYGADGRLRGTLRRTFTLE